MATSRKILREAIKNRYIAKLTELFKDEDVLRTGSNEISFPVTDQEGNEDFIVLTVKIPTGSRDGEVYDGYEMAREYGRKCAENAEKEKIARAKKEKKIARDKAEREAQKKLKTEKAERKGE